MTPATSLALAFVACTFAAMFVTGFASDAVYRWRQARADRRNPYAPSPHTQASRERLHREAARRDT